MIMNDRIVCILRNMAAMYDFVFHIFSFAITTKKDYCVYRKKRRSYINRNEMSIYNGCPIKNGAVNIGGIFLYYCDLWD